MPEETKLSRNRCIFFSCFTLGGTAASTGVNAAGVQIGSLMLNPIYDAIGWSIPTLGTALMSSASAAGTATIVLPATVIAAGMIAASARTNVELCDDCKKYSLGLLAGNSILSGAGGAVGAVMFKLNNVSMGYIVGANVLGASVIFLGFLGVGLFVKGGAHCWVLCFKSEERPTIVVVPVSPSAIAAGGHILQQAVQASLETSGFVHVHDLNGNPLHLDDVLRVTREQPTRRASIQ